MSKNKQLSTTRKIEAKNNGSELVKFIFKNFELEGGDLRFFYGDSETPSKSYHFLDGEQYEAPYSVAEHLAFNTSYPVHNYQMDENNRHIQSIGKRVQRYGVIPLNFIFKKTPPSNLVTVQRVNPAMSSLSL